MACVPCFHGMCAVLYFEEEKYDEVYEETGGKRCCGYGCSNIGCNICVFCICPEI